MPGCVCPAASQPSHSSARSAPRQPTVPTLLCGHICAGCCGGPVPQRVPQPSSQRGGRPLPMAPSVPRSWSSCRFLRQTLGFGLPTTGAAGTWLCTAQKEPGAGMASSCPERRARVVREASVQFPLVITSRAVLIAESLTKAGSLVMNAAPGWEGLLAFHLCSKMNNLYKPYWSPELYNKCSMQTRSHISILISLQRISLAGQASLGLPHCLFT